MLDNIILMTDSYKATHWKMYPPGTEHIYSYLEARAGGEYREIVFFGLRYLLKRYLKGKRVTKEGIEEADGFFKAHFGLDLFNRAGWEHILHAHGGRLPVRIRAVPEGLAIPEGNVLLTIENTDPQCAWLTNHLETLLVQLWYPCTVATISREQKKTILKALEQSGTPEMIDFKLHDFGYRGSTSPESAAIGGAAHLVNFKGTDTLAACELLREYYSAEMPGLSVPAAEHSTITSWGEEEEVLAFRQALEQYPEGFLAVVSDSWDIRRACGRLWGEELKEVVASRKGALIVRPDSGIPEKTLPECLSILGEKFGYAVNKKGYKVLPDTLRLIQGDGITRHSLGPIVSAVLESGYSLDNVAFGSGGGLLQEMNRDTQRFAMKCSYAVVEGRPRDVYKRPADDASKASKKGRLKLVRRPSSSGRGYGTVKESASGTDVLETVFLDGRLERSLDLEEIRKNVAGEDGLK